MEVLLMKEKAALEEASLLRQERDLLVKDMHEKAYPRIHKMQEMIESLLQNYNSLLPIIEMNKKLVSELKELREEKKKADAESAEKVYQYKQKLEEMEKEMEKKLDECHVDASNKAKDTQEYNEKVLKKKDEEIQTVKKAKEKQEIQHEKEISSIQKQNHKSQEGLKNQIAQLQQKRSTVATSNLDYFANKLQATRSEYEAQLHGKNLQLTEKDAHIAKLTEELKSIKEDLRHQKLRNVVRNINTRPSITQDSPGPTSHGLTPRTSPVFSKKSVEQASQYIPEKDAEANSCSEVPSSGDHYSDKQPVFHFRPSDSACSQIPPTVKVATDAKHPLSSCQKKAKVLPNKSSKPVNLSQKHRLISVQKKDVVLLTDDSNKEDS